MSTFKVGQLVRRIDKLTGREGDWACFLLLEWSATDSISMPESGGFWKVLTPDGMIMHGLWDNPAIWELAA